MNDDDALSPQAGRYGERVRGGGVSFRCAACGEMAAVVRLVRAGTTVNMGPPLGEQAYDRDGVVVDFWLGSTCWRRLDPDRWARIEQVLTAGQPDPGGLHQIDWELAAYWCRDCRRCYCRDDWQKTVVWDGPFYDYTDLRHEALCEENAHRPAVRGGRALKLRKTGSRTDQVDLALPRSPARAVETTRPAKGVPVAPGRRS